MGLYDRDYMRQPPDDEERRRRRRTGEGKLEEFSENFLQRYPRLPLYCGIGLVVLLVLLIVGFKLADS